MRDFTFVSHSGSAGWWPCSLSLFFTGAILVQLVMLLVLLLSSHLSTQPLSLMLHMFYLKYFTSLNSPTFFNTPLFSPV